MEGIRDDPRDVLALLNSLGFVGITAPQLKAFMKDLKMYRKVKKQERQRWKEITAGKIIAEQEDALEKMFRDAVAIDRSDPAYGIDVPNDSKLHQAPSIRIRVRRVSEHEENHDKENQQDCNNRRVLQKRRVRVNTEKVGGRQNGERASLLPDDADSAGRRRERSKSNERSFRPRELLAENSVNVLAERRRNAPENVSRAKTRVPHGSCVPSRPFSAPILTEKEAAIPVQRSKSTLSASTELSNIRGDPSKCSTNSQTKSFIRPWKLHPEAQKAARAKKCDPVALYQKYQEGWKRISFPGEDRHARLRWAIREKMLGTDPNPRPMLKKSWSVTSMIKR